jgi:phage baseplate assembly protein W
MDPNFGTNLRQLVFSLQGPIVDDAAFGDVSQAIATYEPRVELTTLQATPAGGRVINIAATASSLINGKSVALQSTSGGVNQ